MIKSIIVIIVIVINVIYILGKIISEILSLRKEAPKGVPCKKLQNGKCTSRLMEKTYYQKNGRCERERCPGFVANDAENSKVFGWAGFARVFFEQLPALAAVVLLVLNFF